MEFGKYLGKGLWGIADKALPVVYGISYVAFVIRLLPREEFGHFVLVQEVFLIISGLTMSLALIPLLKFTTEEHADHRTLVGTSLYLQVFSMAAASVLLLALRGPIAAILNTPPLADLLLYVPLLLAASFFRNTALILLQTRFLIREIFWVDAAHFLGAPLLIVVALQLNAFRSALDLIGITTASLFLSSLVGVALAHRMLRAALRPNTAEFMRFWEYGKYASGSLVSSLFYTKADTFILSAFTGPVHVAAYNAAKVFTRVFEMIAQVIQTFVMPAVSKMSSRGEHEPMRIMTEKAILFPTLALLPVVLLYALGADVLIGFYGGKYAGAAAYLRIMAVVGLAVPATQVASSALMGLGHSRAVFVLHLKVFAWALAAYFLFIPGLEAPGAALGFALTSFVFAWLGLRALRRSIPISPGGTLRRTADVVQFVRSRLAPGRSGGKRSA